MDTRIAAEVLKLVRGHDATSRVQYGTLPHIYG